MHIWATKDNHEREEDEAERLVRPAPKVKPPRDDLRRETVRPDHDPDTNTSEDVHDDPDMSLNYKRVGGSVIERVVARHLQAAEMPDRVIERFLEAKVRRPKKPGGLKDQRRPKPSGGKAKLITVEHVESGKPVQVSEDTLKREPGKYKKIEEKPGQSSGPEETKPPREPVDPKQRKAPSDKAPSKRDPGEAAHEIQQGIQDYPNRNRKLKMLVDGFKTDKALSQWADKNPDKPLAEVYPDVDFPKGVTTVGEFAEVVRAKPVAPKSDEPKPQADKPKSPPEQADQPKGEPEAKPDKVPVKDETFYGQAAHALKELAKTDPNVEQAMKDARNPKGTLVPWAKTRPNTPLTKLWPDTKFPAGVETVGDLVSAATAKPVKPPKPKKAPKEPKPEAKNPDEGPPAQEPPPEKADEGKPDLGAPSSPERFEGPPKQQPPGQEPPDQSALPGQPPTPDQAQQPSAPDQPKQPDGAKPDEPKPGKPKPGEPEAKPGKDKKPAKREKLKSLEPQRITNDADRQKAVQLAYGSLPRSVATDLLMQNLHPAEIKAFIEEFKDFSESAMSMNIDMGDEDSKDSKGSKPTMSPSEAKEIIETARSTYETDPAKIKPPKTWQTRGGEVLKWENLDPDEQAEAMSAHRARVLAVSYAAKALQSEALKSKGIPGGLADGLSEMLMRKPPDKPGKGGKPQDKGSAPAKDDPERQKQIRELANKTFQTAYVAGGSSAMSPEKAQKAFEALPDDPEVRAVATAYFQANDYHWAQKHFPVSEHDTPKQIAKTLHDAIKHLDETETKYPEDARRDIGTGYRRRMLDKLKTLAPDKAKAVHHYLNDLIDGGYNKGKAQYEKAKRKHDVAVKNVIDKWRSTPEYKKYQEDVAKWKADIEKGDNSQGGSPYREAPDGGEGGGAPERTPKPTPPEKPKLPPKPKPPRSNEPSEDLLKDRKVNRKKKLKELARAVQARWIRQISTYPPRLAMASTHRHALYHGIEPNDVPEYPGWTQAHQRDLGDKDYNILLASARDWLKQSVLSTKIEGVVRDTQLRAALDLAIRTAEDGRYSVGLHPAVYNRLLAKLAGESSTETLLTVRASGEGNQTRTSYAATDLRPAKSHEESTMTIKFSSEQANDSLSRIDRVAALIQKKAQSWGMPFEDAKAIVNDLDKVADTIEIAAFGEESFVRRQAEVIQRDPDEGYMDTFNAPMAPKQTDADEPYMAAYKDDQSTAVNDGKSTTGRPLAP